MQREDAKTPDTIEDPGPLRGQAWLTIQTHQAQRFIRGRKETADKPAIIGLTGFADRLRMIWQAARDDDPYADWWLIKVHEALETAGAFISEQQAELDHLLEAMSGLEVAVAGSQKPCRVPLQFANPYAYRGAHLLSQYDNLVRTMLTARHIGLLDNGACEGMLKSGGRKLRATFRVPQGYRFLGIDRATLSQGGPKCDRARRFMGELPEDVLSGERQAPLTPRKVQFPAGFAGNVTLHPGSPQPETDQPEAKNTGT